MERTADPHVFIEARGEGWIRYRNVEGRRWEVHGTCDRRGDCLIGSVIDGETIRDHEHLTAIAARKPGRIDSELDVPVTPEFITCCGARRFHYVELEPVD